MTYAELSSAIQNYLQNYGATLVANIPTIVRQAEDRIFNAVYIPALRKSFTGTCTQGNEYLTLPTDFLAPFSLSVTVGGSYAFLLNKEVSFIREAYPVPSDTGSTRYYALFDNTKLILGPTPSGNFPVELHYFYKPESIVDAGTSWLGDHAESVLLYGCLVEAYTFEKGDADLMKLYSDRYVEALERLKNLGEARNKTDEYRRDLPRKDPT